MTNLGGVVKQHSADIAAEVLGGRLLPGVTYEDCSLLFRPLGVAPEPQTNVAVLLSYIE